MITQDQVKKAQIQQYSNGERHLKIFLRTGRLEVLNLEHLDWELNRQPWLRDVVEHCLASSKVCPIDNRTTEELVADWEEAILRCYRLGIAPTPFEQWRANEQA